MSACTRFPCDSAHSGRSHEPDSDGEVQHRVSVGSGDDWSVSITAWDDDPWCVDVKIPEALWTFEDVEEAANLGHAIAKAAVWALKATARASLTHA